MMRIVQYEHDTTSLPYRTLQGLAVVAAVFSVVVAVCLVANTVRLKSADPVHAPALQTLLDQLKSNPQDAALREQIRELDLLARRAFFGSHQFNQVAAWLLAGGLLVTVLALKTLNAARPTLPYPNPEDPKDVPADDARWARGSVTAIALVLVGMALILALPWRSPLDHPAAPAPATATIQPTAASQTAPRVAPPPAVTATPPALPASASRGERREQWPSLRGAASAQSAVPAIPVEWNGATGQGIAWKAAIPLPGFNSPIVWKDHVFVSGGTREACAVFCVDAVDGRIRWRGEVKPIAGAPTPTKEISDDTGYAASTMTTDGVRVFALFATGQLAAFDFEGRLAWTRHLGVPDLPFGYGSSLEMHEDVLIVQMDQEKDSYVTGLDSRTGSTRWKTPRRSGAAWASPSVVEIEGKATLLLAGMPSVTAYDPANGRELWQVECLKDGDVAPMPVYADGVLYVAADRAHTAAIDVKTRRLLWQEEEEIPAISTPLVTGGLLIAGLADGGILCRDARTGARLWLHETDHGFYSSPILVQDRVYLLERSGRMHIFKPERAGYKAVATPELGEESVATPAVHGRGLILRGLKNLYRIGS